MLTMMNIKEVLNYIIDPIINFYLIYNKEKYGNEIIIKHYNELYIDMYNRIYNGYVLIFKSEEVDNVFVLADYLKAHKTYNKLSEEVNILETLATYIDNMLYFNLDILQSNVIITINSDIPFERGLNITSGWIKQIIDIYR